MRSCHGIKSIKEELLQYHKLSLVWLTSIILIIISIFYRPNNSNTTFMLYLIPIISFIVFIIYLVLPRTSCPNKKKVRIFLAIFLILLIIPNLIIALKIANFELNWLNWFLNN